jgi:shikimate dehydrogenase
MSSQLLPQAIEAMRTLQIRGFGVSMPFKIEVMPLLDELDPLAKQIGAVNTIVNDDGHLIGHNSDWIGAVRALEEVLGPDGLRKQKCLLIGAGGAARAIAFGLMNAGASLTIANRTLEKASKLASHTGAEHACDLSILNSLEGFSVIINASSAGMASSLTGSLVPSSQLRADLTVMDAVYDPIETELVIDAKSAGARTVDGSRMLLHQAARQFELYTGKQAPLEAMNAALREASK